MAWYSRIERYLQSMGFTKSEAEPTLYFILFGSDTLILVMYIDDLFLIGGEGIIAEYKAYLESKFEMKEIGLMHYLFRLEVWQVSGEILLGQGKYGIETLTRFRMEDCKMMATPMITNLKKVINSYLELVDPRIYR
jgi:hypothetical protein